MNEPLSDKLEAFARDCANAMPNGPYMFLRQTLGGCVQRNIGEITAALRERESRLDATESPDYLRGYAAGTRDAISARGKLTSDIPGPPPEQEVKHLAEQCAILLAENERMRTALSDSNSLFAAMLLEKRPDEEIERQVTENNAARFVIGDAIRATPGQVAILDEIENVALRLHRLVRKADGDSEIIQIAVAAQKLILDYGRTFPRRASLTSGDSATKPDTR